MEAKAKGVVNLLSESSSSSSDEDRIIQEVGEQLIVTVKTPTHGSLDGEPDEMVRKEEAVCKFCFEIFQADNVLKTKCSCEFITLIHEECAIECYRKQGNIKCTACEQDIENIPVTLSGAKDIQSTPAMLSRADKEKLEKPSSTTKR
ncbi:hypothetical protein BUALT_Bualt14G0033200 [Buddleja alternifolia]|uniref:RING-CH-type domain-containing protein n=1 Tax=Buddleja alternifolia TaxID=168488 RepID=A0AAV6WEG6_9LAMI|nr:hypothetical protein BUALT_Bualt14G0033200 [Buddleja alternifolia]